MARSSSLGNGKCTLRCTKVVTNHDRRPQMQRQDNELYLITFAFSNANLLQKNSDFNILLKMKRMICTVKLNDHYKNAITDLRRFVFGLNLEK